MNKKLFAFSFCLTTSFDWLKMRNIIIFLALISTTVYTQVILEKSDHDVIDRDDDYWYVKGKVN